MNQVLHVVSAVHVASFAVVVVWILDLVTNHILLTLKVTMTIIVGTFDLAHGWSRHDGVPWSFEAGFRDQQRQMRSESMLKVGET